LQRVCFNGKASGTFERGFRNQGYDTRVLPSTSPAYTLAFDRKLEMWRAAWSSNSPEP
jgi:G:T/U-mismatch repair DNA glycosylase